MRDLLLVVFLGLFAVVHSTAINTVTQIPTRPEDDVLREAITDGFLVDLPTLTTESPKINTTTPTSQQLFDEPKDSDDMEGSASGESPVSIFFQQHTTTTGPHSSTQSPMPVSTSTSAATHHSETTGPEEFSGDAQGSGSGLEDETILSTFSNSRLTSSSMTETSTAMLTTTTATSSINSNQMLTENEGSASGSGSGSEPRIPNDLFNEEILKPGKAIGLGFANPTPGYHKGHSTPDWIIILGFLVGVALLVMLCVAIATRDKWNRPNQASMKQEPKTDSSKQQRELEMETFLHSEEPVENGKAAEYTVIPLDELPEDYSSH